MLNPLIISVWSFTWKIYSHLLWKRLGFPLNLLFAYCIFRLIALFFHNNKKKTCLFPFGSSVSISLSPFNLHPNEKRIIVFECVEKSQHEIIVKSLNVFVPISAITKAFLLVCQKFEIYNWLFCYTTCDAIIIKIRIAR